MSALVILGMHRSGTSCLAGSLEEAGLELGPVDRERHTNPKGNRENLAVMDLNNAVLEANGASWHAPPETACRWTDAQRAWRDRLLSDYPDDRPWGFKDPRTLLVLEGWLEALPGARLVGTFRHPLAVARSLQDRNGFAIGRSVDLWVRYNRKLLEVMTRHVVPLVCFDWPKPRYDAAVGGLARQLGLAPPEGAFDFFEPGMRRFDPRGAAEKALPPDAEALYDALCAHGAAVDPTLADRGRATG